ncbi:MAG: carbonate dehydratase [bacterium]
MQDLFEKNREWAEQIKQEDPAFFEKLSEQQAPEYLWIGCSDSRVPANEIVGLLPGELFVHRNVANMVVHTDLNCLSVIQFAVEYLKVKHVMVVGHYGCGGVRAAVQQAKLGLIDNWLRHIKDVQNTHGVFLQEGDDVSELADYVGELNVLEQALNVCNTSIVQDAWARGQSLTVHSWIYGIGDGLIKDLGLTTSAAENVEQDYRNAVAQLRQSRQQA